MSSVPEGLQAAEAFPYVIDREAGEGEPKERPLLFGQWAAEMLPRAEGYAGRM